MSITAAVITISDKGFRGEREDTSGPMLRQLLEEQNIQVIYCAVVPDETEAIKDELIRCSDVLAVHLVLTTGGTGMSPRDVTPEATLAVIQRQTPGISEAMRADSMRITPRGCLSRGVAGIRGQTWIINLPGSPKAAKENFEAISGALEHGLQMLASAGSADCAQPMVLEQSNTFVGVKPSMDTWLAEAKALPQAEKCGMYLFHNGVVRATPRAEVRNGEKVGQKVQAVRFSHNRDGLQAAVCRAEQMPGIGHVRVWMNEGCLKVGEDLMLVLVGGDIRLHVVECLQTLVEEIKSNLVIEEEIMEK